MASVTLKGAQKTYANGFKAIHGIDLGIEDGEFTVLVGPSGCGKSTLLRMVAGLETVTGGDIEIGERRVNDLEPSERDIAMVFQNYALYPHMRCYDNMAYGLRNRGTPKAEIDRRVREAAGILEIEPLLDRKPRQLSGGQRQRVAMGRAIVREPEVFLFDEPLSNLDAKLRVQMRLEIKRLQKRLGTTSIYVTHDQVEAMTMADRLVVMNAGVAEQVGTPLDVYARPATRFVAGFIGSPAMNFLTATIAPEGGAVVLENGERLAVAGGRADAHAGQAVTLGLRPEHLSISETEQAAAGAAIMHLQVEVSEPLGAETLIHGHVGDSRDDVTVRVAGTPVIAPGATLAVAVQAQDVHLFDNGSGHRI